MPDVAVLLTAYNRPKLVQDAIASVLEQDCDRARLIILDDGSNNETRVAISKAVDGSGWVYRDDIAGGIVVESSYKPVTWWRGPDRSMAERRASIPYSVTINIGLNYLLHDTDKYICYLVDDDMLYPESVRGRAEYLDAHPDVHVVYGRSRSVQYGADGSYNKWADSGLPNAGRHFPRPTQRVLINNGQSARTYFENGERDPETGLDYVEEAFWYPGPVTYGKEGSMDHNQVVHRRQCLHGSVFPEPQHQCRDWPILFNSTDHSPVGYEYWGEGLHWGVGDYAFFSLLGQAHPFVGVDVWTCVKRFHSKSWGNPDNEVRE